MSSENNKNIVHINSIEGLLSQVNEHLYEIEPENPTQHTSKDQALDEIDEFQKTTLFELRNNFE